MSAETLFLTHAELVELTGYRMTCRQIEWLSANGIPHFVNRLKRPVVSRESLSVIQSARKHQNDDFQLGEVA